jgi:tRNA-modifying protein YgfZ
MEDDARTLGARALATTAGVRRLPDQVLRVSGDDARSWLNGQITNDVALPAPGAAVYALVVSLKGRVVTDLFVLDRDDTLDLVLPAGQRQRVAEYLDGFIIMEDVELTPVDDVAIVSVQGPRASEVRPEDLAAASFPCVRLDTDGCDWIVPAVDAERAFVALVAGAKAVGGGMASDHAWELARIRAGVPALGQDFGEDTYPQEAGLKERAVSFGKGCYQGQEAVVMLEHRGKPPKKLVRLAVSAAAPPAPGTPLSDGDGREVGRITSAAADPEAQRSLALGYLKRDHACVGERYVAGGADATVERVLGG